MANSVSVVSSVNQAGKISTTVFSALTTAGMDPEEAAHYALFAQDVYNFIEANPNVKKALVVYKSGKAVKDVYDGTKLAVKANTLLDRAAQIGISTDAAANVRGGGVGTVLSGIVDVMEVMAERNGLELNPCAIAITKVSLDGAGMLAGGVTAETGVGLVLAAMSFYSLGTDSYSLGKACISPVLQKL